MSLTLGDRLAHYDVTALIGEGGMGQVYQATDTKLNRQVALKILPEAFATDPDRLARFQREAQVLASLNHPNIAQIHGIEEDEGTRALVLELVEGPTLADRISEGSIPLDEALPIAKQIAEALEAAHEAGVIHRDLKPANIKVREDGTVKVLDFGLAKALDPNPTGDPSQSPTLTAAATQMGVIMGTAAYMSPEQAAGQAADARSDIWSFGVVLLEMLTGERLFTGKTVSHVMAKVLDREIDFAVLPASTPAPVRRLLRRCLEREQRRRLRDVGEALSHLEEAATGPAGNSAPRAAALVSQPHVWRRALAMALGISAVAMVVTGLAVWNLKPGEPRAVTRFTYDLPTSHQLTGRSRAVLAVSPDGRRFVYNTSLGLYLRSMDTLEARLLPGTEEVLRNPAFSPDGQSLVYFAGLDGQLKRLALSGGAPVVLCDATSPLGVSWEADGTILFGQPAGIMRVSASGGTPELVIPAAEGELLDLSQLLDGDTVLFSASAGGGVREWAAAQIVVQSLTSGERTVLVEGGADARYVSTGHLVYALADGLFAVGFDPDSLRVLGGPVSLVQGVVRANYTASANYTVSNDGTLFYLADSAGFASPLVWVDRTGSVEVIETIPSKGYGTPRLSPNGEQVLVVADGDAWVYDLASGRETRVTTDGGTERYADWRPSGGEVTYTSTRETGGGSNIWIELADGSGPARQLTALDGRVHFDDWAPDGQTFSAHHHTSDGSNNQLIVRFDETDAESEVWLEREFTDSNGVFSPDGRYVAYITEQTGQREIQIRPYPGPGGQMPVSVGGAEQPAWAANGELFYRRPDDYAMMVVDVSTEPSLVVGQPRELFQGTVSPGGSPRARYAVTADGTRFLMSADEVTSGQTAAGNAGPQVTVVLNWVEALKERVPVP